MKVELITEEKMDELIGKIDAVHKTLLNQESDMTIKKKWLTVKEAADFLSVSTRTMQNYRDRGKIPYSNFGGKILFLQDHLQEFLVKHMVPVRGFRNLNERG